MSSYLHSQKSFLELSSLLSKLLLLRFLPVLISALLPTMPCTAKMLLGWRLQMLDLLFVLIFHFNTKNFEGHPGFPWRPSQRPLMDQDCGKPPYVSPKLENCSGWRGVEAVYVSPDFESTMTLSPRNPHTHQYELAIAIIVLCLVVRGNMVKIRLSWLLNPGYLLFSTDFKNPQVLENTKNLRFSA